MDIELTKTIDPKHGVSGAVNLDPPSDDDLKETALIKQILIDRGLFENNEQLAHRHSVLSKLDNMVKEWVFEVGLSLGMSEAEAKRGGGKIFTFGSYKLGIAQPNSDIDALCCAPRHVTRESFFTSLHLKLSETPGVTELKRVQEAFTPLMNFLFDGIEIDLLFASLNVDSIGKNLPDLTNDNLLRSLDGQTVRSINGSRVADSILHLIPDYNSFTLTLRFIKEWAGARGIYSNVLGYFGGITWALLVARVCQMYPKACPSQLIEHFFETFSNWQWGRYHPVILCPVEMNKLADPGFTSLSVWNPLTHVHDRHHLMPILTPAFPSMNSTHNVSKTTFAILKAEIDRGKSLVAAVKAKKASWKDFMTPYAFFDVFKHFIEVQIQAKDTSRLHLWHGFVEANLRNLLKSLEGSPFCSFRPYPKTFAFDVTPEMATTSKQLQNATPLSGKLPSIACFYFGMDLKKPSAGGLDTSKGSSNLDLRPHAQSFLETVLFKAPSTSLEAYKKGTVNLKVNYLGRKDLSDVVRQSAGIVKVSRGDLEAKDEDEKLKTEENGTFKPLQQEERQKMDIDIDKEKNLNEAGNTGKIVPVILNKGGNIKEAISLSTNTKSNLQNLQDQFNMNLGKIPMKRDHYVTQVLSAFGENDPNDMLDEENVEFSAKRRKIGPHGNGIAFILR